MSTPTKHCALRTKLYVSAMVGVFGLSMAGTSAQMLGPMPPDQTALVSPVPLSVAGTMYVGSISEGETHEVQCTVTDCEEILLCVWDWTPYRLQLHAGLLPGDSIVLYAADMFRGIQSVEVTGPLGYGEIEVTQGDDCLEAWVWGKDIEVQATYVLSVNSPILPPSPVG